MQPGGRGPDTTSSDIAAARRWADRLERPPWRWLFARGAVVGIVVGVVVGFVGMLGVYEWWRYTEVAHGAEPLPECQTTEPPERAYDVRWQWLPPGLVCVYADGERRYVGP